jgi:limonene-1,2-epoxide hydrolase
LRILAALALLVPALLAGCGGNSDTPESVVRAWSDALNAGDNERAANLFAPGAEVVQPGRVIFLRTHAQAVEFNSALPCSGKIISVATKDDTATATFLLGNRKTSRCDGPGSRAIAAFEVHHGKIVLWHQLPTPSPQPAPPI